MTETENSHIIPFSSWNTVEDGRLEVPKHDSEHLPEWAKVAAAGFADWLRFWGLETFREHPDVVQLMELGITAPPPTEDEALRNLELQAKALRAPKFARQILTEVEQYLFDLEREFLDHCDTIAFQRKYGVWRVTQRYQWVAERTKGQFGVHQVKAVLEEVSLVLGEYVTLDEEETHQRELEHAWRELVREAMRDAA